MRIFRSVYNKAVTQKIVEQTFPFKNVYTGVDKTRKRAVTETVISQLLSIDLKKSKALQFARDLFIFSFYTRGICRYRLFKEIKHTEWVYYLRQT